MTQGIYLLFLKLLMFFPSHIFRIVVLKYLFRMKIGSCAHLYMGTEIRKPQNITVGENTIIGHNCVLDGRAGITIGKNVNFSSEVMVWTLQHDPDDKDFGIESKPVVIGDRAWLSCRSIILPGVEIGEGTIIAAGSVVTKSVPPYSICGGIPAKVIRSRNRDINYELNKFKPAWFI